MTDTISRLRAANTRTVWLLQTGPDTAPAVPEGTPGAVAFELARVPADRLRTNLLYAVLGRDGYVQYANWYSAQANQDLERVKRQENPTEEPFDDTLPEDTRWRAHTLALETAAEQAVLEVGLLSPTYAEAGEFLGVFRLALVRELVQWGREVPDWNEQEEGSGNLSRASSGAP